MIGVIRAAFVAIIWGDKRWQRFTDMLRLLWSSRYAPKADEEVIARRNAFCRACPIFYKPLETCGSPLSDAPDLGCYCAVIAAKNKLKLASCWLRDNTGAKFGWPEGL